MAWSTHDLFSDIMRHHRLRHCHYPASILRLEPLVQHLDILSLDASEGSAGRCVALPDLHYSISSDFRLDSDYSIPSDFR